MRRHDKRWNESCQLAARDVSQLKRGQTTW
jgi:hypothetical protein